MLPIHTMNNLLLKTSSFKGISFRFDMVLINIITLLKTCSNDVFFIIPNAVISTTKLTWLSFKDTLKPLIIFRYPFPCLVSNRKFILISTLIYLSIIEIIFTDNEISYSTSNCLITSLQHANEHKSFTS